MVPAAPFDWASPIQTPSWLARQAGTAADETRAVSDASAAPDAAPDELVAKAAVVMTSPATEATAMVAITRRAVCGKVERYFMVRRPKTRDPRCAASLWPQDGND